MNSLGKVEPAHLAYLNIDSALWDLNFDRWSLGKITQFNIQMVTPLAAQFIVWKGL
jgi:hypothetical protein